MVAGANGRINLSVPLIGGRDQRTISKDVRIDNSTRWQLQHFRTIVSAYNRSPFFQHFEFTFPQLFEKRFEFLFDWNLVCLEWLKQSTGANWIHSRAIKDQRYPETRAVKDLRDEFFPRKMATREAPSLSYRQVFEERNGFFPQLSILDFLFCAGPNEVLLAAARATELDRN